MKQKPILFLLMVIAASIGAMFSPLTERRTQNQQTTITEGTHAQNSNLAITCPGSFTTSNTPTECAIPIHLTLPTSNCTITGVSYVIAGDTTDLVGPFLSPINIGNFGPGSFPVRWIMTDCNGTAFCTQNVLITDNSAPQFNCPMNINTNCSINDVPPYSNFAAFMAAGGSASDACGINVDSFKVISTILTPGSIPPVYCRTYQIKDVNNNLATCIQKIIVEDVIKPVITCPTNVTVGNALDGRTIVLVGQATATDACGILSILNDFNGTDDASGDYPLGNTTVCWTATDNFNNTASCCMTVTVLDNTPPIITCPDTIKVECVKPLPYTTYAQFFAAGGMATDDVSLDTSPSSFYWIDDASNNMRCPETIRRRYRIADTQGNADTCTQIISIHDKTAPTAMCKNLIVYIPTKGDTTILAAAFDNGSTDNCGFPLIFSANRSLFFACNDARAVQPIPIIITISDSCNNIATCNATITVRDTIRPLISCPANITVNKGTGVCYATNPTLGIPVTSDNCLIESTTAFFNGNIVNTTTQFPVGNTNIVTWVVRDVNGNTNSCTQIVVVIDNQPPVITCPTNMTVNAATGLCLTTVTYTAPNVSDDCSAVSVMQTTGFASGATFPVGVTTNTFVVTTSHGATASCSFTVTVIDNQAPVILCPTNITVSADPSLCSAIVNYTAPVVMDNCLGATPVQTTGLATGSSFPVGVTTNTFVVTAANGVTASCSFSVTVVDTMLPQITCPGNITINTTSGLCSATYSYMTPVGTDNCIGATTAQISGLASGSVFPIGVTTNTFRVTAANGATASCSFNVTVVDNQPPTIICPGPRNVALNNNCRLTVPDLRPFVNVSDNCPNITVSQMPAAGTIIPSRHDSMHTFTYVVTDASGLTASCTTIVTAKDSLGPDISCMDPRTINLSGMTTLSASSFVSYGNDACGGILTYLSRRMDGLCGSAAFNSMVSFCCEDVNDTILVITRVTDLRGNFTECMTRVIVHDGLAPDILTPLPDITISCEYPLDLSNLSAFGTYVLSGTFRNNITIADPGNPFYPTGVAGMDGVYSDNCPGSTVRDTVRNLLGMCNTGQIKRDFTIRDSAGNPTRITQTIYLEDKHKFDISDITWPAMNVDFNDCNVADPSATITGAPVLKTDKCNLVGATYVDHTYSFPFGCKLIERTWTVLDWCQYQKNVLNSPGKWTFVQNIYIKNTVAPTIGNLVCRDTMICTDAASCTAPLVTFSASGTDDCLPVTISWSFKIDLNNDGGSPDITGIGSTTTRTYGIGTHKFTWEAKDGCQNVSTCSFLVTIRDCKAPTAIAKNGLAINLAGPMGMARIVAKDFNNFSSDNCTPSSQLRYSFTSNPQDTVILFNCDSLGQRFIQMWVTDQAGNQTVAHTFISVQDNQLVCPGNNLRVNISGSIYTEEKVNISETKVTLGGQQSEGSSMTNKSGNFSFADLSMYQNYQLTPTKDDGHTNGISTIDLVVIQRHILGLQSLESPYKLIAADINNSQSITAADLIELRKMVLGVQSTFTKNTSWRFVDAKHSFDNPAHPWPFNEKLNYQNVSSNMMTSDFIAVKIGDVNGTVSTDLLSRVDTRSTHDLVMYSESQKLKAGELASIPFRMASTASVVGMQWTFELMPGIHFSGIEPSQLPIGQHNMALIERHGNKYLTIAVDPSSELRFNKDDLLFNLLVRPDQDIMISDAVKLNSDITKALAFTDDEHELNVVLRYQLATDVHTSYLAQNQPNPFKDQTNIVFGIHQAGPVTMSIFDIKGTVVFHQNMNLSAGDHSITLGETQLGNQTGIFYCRIQANGLHEVVKMIRIE
ncbi:MAG: HYR domain-containing protein [Saprospiraceae bacterium]